MTHLDQFYFLNIDKIIYKNEWIFLNYLEILLQFQYYDTL